MVISGISAAKLYLILTQYLLLYNIIYKQKSIALKADESDDSKTDEEESALMVRKFERTFRNMKNGDYKVKNKKFTNQLVRHKCGKSDHFIKECPQWEQDKGKGTE